MIMKLLLVKETLRKFYGKYDIYIDPVVKFVLSFLSLWMLKGSLGYMNRLGSVPVMLVAALLCSLLPIGSIVIFFALFLLGHVYALSLEAFIVCALLFCIMFFTYYIFKPGDSIILVLVPLLFWMKVPYLVPLILGLTGTALTAVPASFGVVIYYMIQAVKQNATTLTESETSSMLTRFQLMVDQVVMNRSMMVLAATFVVTIALVYVVRRLSLPHSSKIAIGVGAIAEIAVILAGSTALSVSKTSFSMGGLIVGVLVAALVALLLDFFLLSLDYSRTEYVQFEDDEYYYYVKAVPKMAVTAPQREVKRFAVNQKGREMGLSETVDLGDDVKAIMQEMQERNEK